jgi:PiT family inorganic phosphate transporter
MVLTILLFAATMFVAYANGANDNFKGVATLYGSFSIDYRGALAIGTIFTFLGCLSSFALAGGLMTMFSGAGVVPPQVATSGAFLASVGLGAAATVILATRLGLPVSTTHGLTGAILGAGFVHVGAGLNLSVLGKSFVAPLLISPVASVLLTACVYLVFHRIGRRMEITRETCVCIDGGSLIEVHDLQLAGAGGPYATARARHTGDLITIVSAQQCVEKYGGAVVGVRVQSLVDAVHYVSAAAVSFARGLNDAPKIVGLVLAAHLLNVKFGLAAISLAMAVGGLLNARKVAETMSRKISRMNDGQALAANVVTAFLVVVASRMGMPVSTTHVSVGSIAGVGLVNGTANRSMLSGIVLSWVATLPIAAVLAALTALALRMASGG